MLHSIPMEPVRASVFLPGELFIKVKAEARRNKMAHSEFMRKLIADGLGFRLEIKNDHRSKPTTRKAGKKAETV